MINKKLFGLKNKKAGVSLAVVIVVVATLVLIAFALFSFVQIKLSSTRQIGCYGFMQSAYSGEQETNFLINEILDRVITEVSPEERSAESFSSVFASKIRELELDTGRNSKTFLSILEQLAKKDGKEHVFYDSEKNLLNIDFNLVVINSANKLSEEEDCHISYEYSFRFSTERIL